MERTVKVAKSRNWLGHSAASITRTLAVLCAIVVFFGAYLLYLPASSVIWGGSGIAAVSEKKSVRIVMWTPFFGDDLAIDIQSTFKNFCPDYDCRITSDRTSVWDADAVVFHIRDFKNLSLVPPRRNPRQYYVFFCLESPYHTYWNLKKLNGFFNLTWTYRLDSDLYSSFYGGRFLPKSDAPLNSPPTNITTNELHEIVAGKSKLVAWFVSNCGSHSQRMALVKELQKHVPVDIFGACGSKHCPRSDESACEQMLTDDYKFYVTFENSVCRDYVTEKFYRISRYVVPLVMRNEDYKRIAPKGSYIAVDQFGSVKELAEYLKYLDGNTSAYLKYFDWHYHFYLPGETICPEICTKLATRKVPQHKVYDIDDWFNKKAHCVAGVGSRLAAKGRPVTTTRT